ncbi:hypothetical protein [Levilactobacillus brevis]|uniref:hypothetical protein n=1 Tax=Levilactobacillus brevis TaxID=1580 RepID=UPI001CDB24C6|nr:hypothetical protein [Levilactobacillus brevis]MCZ2120491.1 hypothetical protein [Levilactobacillus brevis]MCZ2125979.1 hypothetical protein [Levilactobacillus brevis]MCZ2210309.1 hypothetical protein [Levilactobacillus brevis]MCZ2325771.1 hypothetical protein [Levilactobacillus brevis]
MASNDEQRSATTILTTAAQSIAARLIANETTAKFTKAEISTTNLFNQSVTELQVLTSLDNVQQTADINTVTVINNNTVNVNVAIDQTKAPNNYQMNSVGLFAVDGDGKEVLYSVTVLKDPVYIHQDAMGSALGIDLETVVGQASNVEISVNPAGAVTNEILKAALADYVKADDSTVVHTADMRKPASDVAGIEEVNTKQDKIGYTPADDSKVAHLSGANNFDTVPTVKNNPLLLASSLPSDLARTGQDANFTAGLKSGGVNVATTADINAVDAKGLARNLIANSGYMVNLDGWQGVQGGILALSTHSFYHNGTGNVIKLINPKTSEAFAFSDWFKVKPNTQYTFQFILFGTANTTSTDVFLIGKGTNVTNIITGYVQSPIKPELITKTFTTGNFEDAYIRVDNNGSKDGNNCYIAFTEVQLEEGTVVHPWTPSYSDVVHRVADNGDGSIRVNGNSYTPADDSKVAHLSGANNFDTVPTVNNNPLLLASSLPSDLARTGQDANFTGKLQQNGQNVALVNNTIARNPDTGRATDTTDFPYKGLTVDGYPIIPLVLVPDRATAITKTAQYPNYAFMYGKELS